MILINSLHFNSVEPVIFTKAGIQELIIFQSRINVDLEDLSDHEAFQEALKKELFSQFKRRNYKEILKSIIVLIINYSKLL